MAYDLMVMERLGLGRAKERADWAVSSLQALPAVGRLCQVTSGFHAPDDLDTDGLRELIEEDDGAGARFQAFCLARGVSESVAKSDAGLAALFLDHEWGVTLATASMPTSEREVAAVYAELVELARGGGIRLWDPQSGAEVDLTNPGALPSMWK